MTFQALFIFPSVSEESLVYIIDPNVTRITVLLVQKTLTQML